MTEKTETNERKKSWAVRHLSFQRPSASAPLLDPDEVRYVERCSGRYIHDNHDDGEGDDHHHNNNNNNDEDKYAPAARTCLVHLRSLVDGKWRAEWDGLLARDYATTMPDDGPRKVIRLSHEVAAVLRKYGGLSLCRLIQKLQAGHVLRGGDGGDNAEGVNGANGANEHRNDLRNDPAAQSLVFSLLGWLSLLYIPAPAPAAIPAPDAPAHEPALRIALQSRSTLRSHVATETASRPLDELLRSFGDILPKKANHHYDSDGGGRAPTGTGLQLEVAQLNVAALHDMAGVRIVWVDALSGHLAFDTAGPEPTLCLFKCPSFCKLHRSDASLLATMLSRFYEDDEKPCRDFSTAKLLGEIILSYDLLFRANTRSRHIYASNERARAALTQAGSADPYLDELCGYGRASPSFSGNGPRRIFYDAAADFPIFQDRLRRIQDHMKGVQPTGFRALWRDQRDLRLWYTIWVVLILTVAGLIIAVVSAVLAGVQVQLAKQAINLQLQQNAQGGGG